MLHAVLIIAALVVCGYLLIRQAAIMVWAIVFALSTALIFQYGAPARSVQILLGLITLVLIFCSITPLRREILSKYLFKIVSKAMPRISATEREALTAGTVSWEGDLFSGSPDFNLLLKTPFVQLEPEEQAFLDGPVNTLCGMLDDWDITHNLTDLPPEVWQFIKTNRFLGMIIPKSYGGLGFSATAQMSVLVKLYGRSISAATTVSVPNSLGPSELLLKYGTEAQKNHYLPRLADGREIPCFALTGPNAGSDAASIPDKGIVCRQMLEGKDTLGIRLNWDKRYITLCPVATVIGLAFRLFDPDNLLGKGEDIGITCALIPAQTPGVVKGRRHFPLNTGFLNGPTQGKNVFIPMDYIIGGQEMAGHGWGMLMECLSAGRAISLPSSASGGAQAIALGTGAYARVRKQFNQPIGRFEGIEEPLARIAANTYMIDSTLTMTASAIDRGAKPSVAGAILKYHSTQRGRAIALDAMDIHGGKGICLGPNNYLGRGYQESPIGITVEGANILTRSLIIFGQGAIRCHPYVLKEFESIKNNDLIDFDKNIFNHFGFILSNMAQSLLFAWTDGRFSKAPCSKVKRYYQLIHKYSSNLAFLADFTMVKMGAELKRKEKISARLGDVLSCLYMASAVLKRFHEDGEPMEDKILVDWSCQQLLHECEEAIHSIIRNFPGKLSRIALTLLLKPLGNRRSKPSDDLGQQLARLLTKPSETRSRLSRLAFTEPCANCPLGRMEAVFHTICAVEELEQTVIKASKETTLKSLSFMEQIEEAVLCNILTKTQANQLMEAELARQEVIKVDDFADKDLRRVPQSHLGVKQKDEAFI